MAIQYDARFTGMVDRGYGVGRAHERITVFDTNVENARCEIVRQAELRGFSEVTIDHIVRNDGGKK